MLGNRPYYHQTHKKLFLLFENLFSDISIVRYNDATGEEVERMKVPIIFGPKEKYITRLASDSDLNREVQDILPRMSFEPTGIERDINRNLGPLLKMAGPGNPNTAKTSYMSVPYNIDVQLSIYARYLEDAWQIIEQILPSFNPNYVITAKMVEDLGFYKDISIGLISVNHNIQYEGAYDSIRYIEYTLGFTICADFYGPIATPKLIRKVITNFYNDPSLENGYLTRAFLSDPSGNQGTFIVDDQVYTGNNFATATAAGSVLEWNENILKLTINGVAGDFKIGQTVRAVSSNAAYVITGFEKTPVMLATIEIVPDPLTANVGDDYGYTTTITEYYHLNRPEIMSVTADSTTVQADSTAYTADHNE